jgi:lipoprotein-releasing system ATP-binding protein
MKKHVIELTNISKEFYQADERTILFADSSYTFTQGETYGIVGTSGTGKSTLLNIIAGIEKPTSGKVTYDGIDIAHISAEKMRLYLQNYFGIIFQYAYLLNELTVLENVEIKGLIAGLSSESARKQASELLDRVGLSHKMHAQPAALSGGEQQRVALARALMLRPPFIIADEPTAHLDEETKRVIGELLIFCQETFGCALIISSHDSFITGKMKHIVRIHQGTLCPA